jgi:hypothetical protein
MTDSVSVGWPVLAEACYARIVFARFLGSANSSTGAFGRHSGGAAGEGQEHDPLWIVAIKDEMGDAMCQPIRIA